MTCDIFPGNLFSEGQFIQGEKNKVKHEKKVAARAKFELHEKNIDY